MTKKGQWAVYRVKVIREDSIEYPLKRSTMPKEAFQRKKTRLGKDKVDKLLKNIESD